MGKKMKLPSLFKATENGSSSWPWPTCGNPKTLSFRATASNDIFKTINTANGYSQQPGVNFNETFNKITSSNRSNPRSIDLEETGNESTEMVIRGLRSERLFFEPGETSSILEEAKEDDKFPFKESVVMAMDSWDPFLDFKRSMEEIVEVHGLKDWEFLEELLSWYLRVNGESNHGYIVGAFVELLVGVSSNFDVHCSSSTITTTTHSFTSSSTYTSPCISSLEAEDEIEKTVDNASSSSDV